MALKPVVLRRHIRQGPLASQLQWWHTFRLIALRKQIVVHPGHGNVRAIMEDSRLEQQIRDVNTRYHDAAAAEYDAKWGIDFGEIGRAQVTEKFERIVGRDRQFGHALEIGAGTGYFGLNLMRAGLIKRLTATDISNGMVETLLGNAEQLGLQNVSAVQADSEALPFADESFDIVLGHAVLHHLPSLERSFAEFYRVLKPGGRIVFAGEPSRLGDQVAKVPKQLALLAAPVWRRLLGVGPAPEPTDVDDAADHTLESQVDIHVFSPSRLTRLAHDAGFDAVSVEGEEMLANWFGWFNRSLEASGEPGDIPMFWRQYAFRGYLLLQSVDHHALEPRLPPGLFYNLLLSARRPLAEPDPDQLPASGFEEPDGGDH